MALRTVQNGSGDARPLLFGFLIGTQMDSELRAALGPSVCIVADDDAQGTETLDALIAAARARAGFNKAGRIALVGYSTGCNRVRMLLRDGADPAAVLAVDGVHASKPPQAWQLDVWRRYADLAKQTDGKHLFVATHTQQLYVEDLPPSEGGPLLAVRSALREVTGYPLESAGPLDYPVSTHRGDCHVYSYESARIDRIAHMDQLRTALPALLRRHVTPRLAPTCEVRIVRLPLR